MPGLWCIVVLNIVIVFSLRPGLPVLSDWVCHSHRLVIALRLSLANSSSLSFLSLFSLLWFHSLHLVHLPIRWTRPYSHRYLRGQSQTLNWILGGFLPLQRLTTTLQRRLASVTHLQAWKGNGFTLSLEKSGAVISDKFDHNVWSLQSSCGYK